jgi:hypothetical protein
MLSDEGLYKAGEERRSMGHWWNATDMYREREKYSEKYCPHATSSTINSTWADLRLNSDLGGERLRTKPPERLLHITHNTI